MDALRAVRIILQFVVAPAVIIVADVISPFRRVRPGTRFTVEFITPNQFPLIGRSIQRRRVNRLLSRTRTGEQQNDPACPDGQRW